MPTNSKNSNVMNNGFPAATLHFEPNMEHSVFDDRLFQEGTENETRIKTNRTIYNTIRESKNPPFGDTRLHPAMSWWPIGSTNGTKEIFIMWQEGSEVWSVQITFSKDDQERTVQNLAIEEMMLLPKCLWLNKQGQLCESSSSAYYQKSLWDRGMLTAEEQ